MRKIIKEDRIFWITDFFADMVPGGAQFCDNAIMEELDKNGIKYDKNLSRNTHWHQIANAAYKTYIISNFVQTNPTVLNTLINKKCNYIIYEHDHKYCRHRNPIVHNQFLFCDCYPKDSLLHQFYKNAKYVICQTKYHKEILDKNVRCNSISLGATAYSDSELQILDKYKSLQQEAIDKYGVFNSPFEHKNTHGAIQYCIHNKLKYKLLGDLSFENFIKELSKLKGFVFLPKLCESASRMVFEAKYVGCKSIVTNDLVGYTHEDWWNKDNVDMKKIVIDAKQKFIDIIKGL